MKLIIRILALILSVLISAMGLAGCESDGKKEAPTGTKGEDIGIISPGEPTTIKMLFWQIPHDWKLVAQEIEKRTAKSLNIKIKMDSIDEMKYANLAPEKQVDYLEKLIREGGYDIIDGKFIIASRELCTRGVFKDITELLPMYAPEYYARFPQDVINEIMVQGTLFTLPLNYQGSNRICVFVRKALMDKYNIPPIKNFDDYEEFLRVISANEPDYAPLLASRVSTSDFIQPFGYVDLGGYMVYSWNDPEMKMIPWEKTEGFRLALDYINRWKDKGYLKSGGKEASMLGIIDNADYFADSWREELQVYPLYPDENAEPAMYRGIAFGAESQNIDKALALVEWLYSSQENYDLLLYGIKGEHYELIDGRVKPLVPWAQYSGRYFFYSLTDIEFTRPSFYSADKDHELQRSIVQNTVSPPHQSKIGRRKLDLSACEEVISKRYSDFSDGIWQWQNFNYGDLLNGRVEEFIKGQEKAADIILTEIEKQLGK